MMKTICVIITYLIINPSYAHKLVKGTEAIAREDELHRLSHCINYASFMYGGNRNFLFTREDLHERKIVCGELMKTDPEYKKTVRIIRNRFIREQESR